MIGARFVPDVARYEQWPIPSEKRNLHAPDSHPYNLSLISSMILHLGEDKAARVGARWQPTWPPPRAASTAN